MDCNASGVSKWTGLSFLMNYFGLTSDEVCCFGDNLNDIEMLQNAGESYAVSTPERKSSPRQNTPARRTGKMGCCRF